MPYAQDQEPLLQDWPPQEWQPGSRERKQEVRRGRPLKAARLGACLLQPGPALRFHTFQNGTNYKPGSEQVFKPWVREDVSDSNLIPVFLDDVTVVLMAPGVIAWGGGRRVSFLAQLR